MIVNYCHSYRIKGETNPNYGEKYKTNSQLFYQLHCILPVFLYKIRAYPTCYSYGSSFKSFIDYLETWSCTTAELYMTRKNWLKNLGMLTYDRQFLRRKYKHGERVLRYYGRSIYRTAIIIKSRSKSINSLKEGNL